jgi:hypothetical protein
MGRRMMAARFDRGGALIDGAIDRGRASISGTFDGGGALIDGAIYGGLGQMASVLGSRVEAN